MKKYVYAFGGGSADGDGKMKDVLGGKGAGLAEMSRAGVFRSGRHVANLIRGTDQRRGRRPCG